MQPTFAATRLPALPLAHARTGLLPQATAALRGLHRASPALSNVGWLNVALAGLALLPLDYRVVIGLPVWLKPLKFSLSMVAYTWTLSWLLADLPAPAQRAVRRIGRGVAGAMLTEQAIIFAQAARGTTSHFNSSSPLNEVFFSIMGLGVVVNTALVGWAGYLAWRYRPRGSAAYAWGLRLGLLEFLVGSVLGGFMIHLNQHTVGGPDGGPGLPGLGWSTVAGDLRIAHFLALQALQALLGWALGRRVPRWAVPLTGVGAALWAGATALLLLGALADRPLF